MIIYELQPAPAQNQKSFYGKAKVVDENGKKTLFSYNTKIMTMKGGTITRHYDGRWTMTTGKHIFAFCGMKKADFEKLPIVD